MMSEQQYYYLWSDYDSIITKMNIKLVEFKQRNPKYDISDQLETINTLRSLQVVFEKQYDVIRTLDSQHGRWYEEKNRLLNKISQLEKENNELKENLNL